MKKHEEYTVYVGATPLDESVLMDLVNGHCVAFDRVQRSVTADRSSSSPFNFY